MNISSLRPSLTLLAITAVLSASVFLACAHAEGEAPAKPAPQLPNALLDDDHARSELGVNEFTAPSIKKIFENLRDLPPIPQSLLKRPRPEKLPMDRGELSLELGFLMADGFILVQAGQMAEVRPLAQELARYAKALGAGERVNRHAASLLKHAEEGNINSLKEELSLTQKDVESELISLRDPDLAHFIGLGGWIRALEVATAALTAEFTPDKAEILFQPDIPEYFDEAMAGLDPLMLRRKDIAAIRRHLVTLQKQMTLPKKKKPTKEQLAELTKTTQALSKLALTRINTK